MEDSGPIDENDPDSPDRFKDELESWETDGSWVSPTGHKCAGMGCGDKIRCNDEVFILTVVVPMMDERRDLYYHPMVAEDGDFLYDPLLFQVECWESLAEEAMKSQADTPAVEDPLAVVACYLCNSGVRYGETAGIATFGEMHLEHGDSNSEGTAPTFQPMDNSPTLVCIACLNMISRDLIELWANYVKQKNECDEGSFMRCWRYGCLADGECERA